LNSAPAVDGQAIDRPAEHQLITFTPLVTIVATLSSEVGYHPGRPLPFYQTIEQAEIVDSYVAFT